MRVLLLRLDAPLVSFGGVMVDHRGFTDPAPGRSMLTGLLANALGFDRREMERHQRLQDRLRHAVREDRRPEPLREYQTVDLGQPSMAPPWTTRGKVAERSGASSGGTHQRERHHLADGVWTVALRLEPPGETPDVDTLAEALERPARPLFVGRKACLPAAPLLIGVREASSLVEAFQSVDALRPREHAESFRGWWPDEAHEPSGDETEWVTDERNWAWQTHVGRRRQRRGRLRRER